MKKSEYHRVIFKASKKLPITLKEGKSCFNVKEMKGIWQGKFFLQTKTGMVRKSYSGEKPFLQCHFFCATEEMKKYFSHEPFFTDDYENGMNV